MTSHEVFWSYGHAARTVVLNPADGEAVVASAGITIAVNVIDIPVIRIHAGMIYPSKKSVDSAKFWSRLRAVAIGHDDSTGHPI